MRTPAGMHAPDDVADVLLWRLAHQVAASHQPHPHDPARCTNLRCTAEVYPCSPARDAARALRACRSGNRPPSTIRGPGRMSAAVPALRQAWDWFAPTGHASVAGQPPMLPRRHPAGGLRAA